MITALVASYGYLAIFIGTLIEGETVLIAAGFAAHRGMLDLPLVVALAIAGGALGDTLIFMIGRWKGEALLGRFPLLAQHRARVHDLLERYDVWFILSVRFIYGLRIAGPLVLGSSRIPLRRFVIFNLIGASIWAVLFAGAGYTFGSTLEVMLANTHRIEEAILVAILIAGVGVWLWRRRAHHRRIP